MPGHQAKLLFLLLLSGLLSCLKLETGNDIHLEKSNLEVAFPLFHSSLSIEEIAESAGAESSLIIDEQDHITLLYRGAVVEGNSTQVFPPAIGLLDIEIPDTIYTYTMPINYWEEIHTMTMGRTILDFKFNHHLKEKIDVSIEILEMTKDGSPFKMDLVMENGNVSSVQSSVEDYLVLPSDNSLTIHYTAKTRDGKKVKLDYAAFNFDVFRIKYIEGIFSPRSIDVQGDVISVGILENWKSGGLTVSGPELYLRVENSFGIQAFSQNGKIDVETTEGQILPLESQILASGITFDYPALDQREEIKVTEIIFDKDNSNLENIFSGRASKIKYDIDAQINNQNSGEPGFISEDSYFRIEAVARMPLNLTIDHLILEQSSDFDGSKLNDVESAEINWLFKNEFPVEMRSQVYLYNNGILTDSIFPEPPRIAAAEMIDLQTTLPSEQMITTIYDSGKLASIREADSLRSISWFNTREENGFVQLLNKYRLHIDAGILAKIKK